MNEIVLETIKWTAPEYSHKEHDNDWFWTIGVVTIAACIIAIWLGSFIFAIFLFISGVCLFAFTARPPQILNFTIETKGLSVEKDFYPWKEIKSFNTKEKEDGEFYKLIIETNKNFLPIHTILMPKEITSTVKNELKKIINHSEIDESRTIIFAEKLGF